MPVAAKPAEPEVAKEKASETKSPVKAEADAPKPKAEREVAETRPVPRAKTKQKATASVATRTKVTARAPARSRVAQRRAVPGQRPDGLVVMRMQTLQFPDGRTVQVLSRPGQAPDPWGASRDAWR